MSDNRSLELYRIIELLKANKNTEVAINLGEHAYCSIESNCPMAIKLRKMIEDMGIKVEDITKNQPVERVDLLFHIPEIKTVPAEVNIDLYGTPLKIDVSNFITDSIKSGIETHFSKLRKETERLDSYAMALHKTYMNEVLRMRKTKILPALSFNLSDLAAAGIYSSCNSAEGFYLFYTPMIYEPKYLYSAGIRYELSAEDLGRLRVENLYLKTSISQSSMLFYSHVILGVNGQKFRHYHGNTSDCWGSIKMNVKWDGTLRNITKVTHELIMSLTTVNGDSLMMRDPPGFPTYQDLLSRATRLGREGEMTPAPDSPINIGMAFSINSTSTNSTAGTGEPVRWGRRT